MSQADILGMVERGELPIRSGKIVTKHLPFGTAYIQLPNYVEYDGKWYWIEMKGSHERSHTGIR